MALHPLAERFADVAGNYERGRPDYPAAAVGAIAAELGLERGDRVLDLAAGTGKLARALLAHGLEVVAVEPLAEMRGVLAERIGPQRAIEGVAEAIPLADGSVRAATVADGFHWFDPQPALADIARVLEPGGGLAVITAAPDWSSASWIGELGSMIDELRPEHPFFDGPPWQDAVRAASGWTEPWQVGVIASQPTSPERIVDYLASMSWVAALPEPERVGAMEGFAEVVGSGETPEVNDVRFTIGLTTMPGN